MVNKRDFLQVINLCNYREGNGRACAKSGYECGQCKNGFKELPQANNQVSERCVPNQSARITTIEKIIPSSTKASTTGT